MMADRCLRYDVLSDIFMVNMRVRRAALKSNLMWLVFQLNVVSFLSSIHSLCARLEIDHVWTCCDRPNTAATVGAWPC